MSQRQPADAHASASSPVARLDRDQRAVAQAPPGPLLVLAGAGSGKTLALAARVACHLEAGHVPPHRVLAITFTTKAARELADRLARLAGPAAAQIECGTHHAVCARMLRRHARLVQRTPRYSIYDPADVVAVLRRVVDPSRTGTLSAEDAQRRIAAAKARLQRPDDLRDSEPRLAALWRALETELRRSDALDFDDLLATSVHLMRDQPAVAEQARARWAMVLVDEFQDTNAAQWAWLELVCAHGNLTALGDDDQAIFGWRGGQVERLLELDRHLPGTRVLKLERNYRSTGAIVQAANRLIAHNAERREKRMWTARDPGPPVAVRSFVDEQAEALAVAAWCRAHLGAGRQPTQLGVLFRARRLAGPLADALLEAQVPFRVVGEVGFLQRTEIRAALAHLQLVANPRDRRALERAAATLPGVGPAAVARICQRAQASGGDLLAAAADADRVRGLTATARRALIRWAVRMNAHREREDETALGRLVGEVVRDCGLPAQLAASDDPLSSGRLQRLRRLARLAGQHARRFPANGLVDFLAALALSVGEMPDENGEIKRVTLATIHSAKGLEWPCVWACGWEEGTLPGRQAIAADKIADERRLAYVAVTRAREELVLSRCWRRAQRWRLPASRFLTEALGDQSAEAAA